MYIYLIEMKGLSRDDQCSYYIVGIDILMGLDKLRASEPAGHASHASHHVSVSHARQMLVPVLVCAA